MPGALQVRLLGQFHLTVDGRPVDGPTTGRLQSLLAYLLLHADAPQSRAHLSFVLWPDASESNGRNDLRQLLHQLRQVLPDPDRYLRADANSVQWASDSPFSLDVLFFDRAVAEAEAAGRAGDAARRRACLERAVDLCQGPLLPSCYDDWIGPAREGLGSDARPPWRHSWACSRSSASTRTPSPASGIGWNTTRSTSRRTAA